MVGMEEWLYQNLESGAFHRSFTPELADKLAALYGIPVEDILDDYTLFLHRGGGAFLRRYREAKGWNRQQLADHAKVSRTSIRCWENGQKTISQKCFCHLVENLGSDFPSMLRMCGMVIFLRSKEFFHYTPLYPCLKGYNTHKRKSRLHGRQ